MKDILGKDIKILKHKKLFLFDMDGTIYNEDHLFDGVLEFLNLIEKINGKYIFITNNSSKSVNDYIKKLKMMNIKVNKDNFCTSTIATILYLNKFYKNKKIYCQGTKSFIKELKKANIDVTEDINEDIDVILVGFDTELTSNKLRKTCEILGKDIPFIATNPDLVCPTSFGYIPDCGSICQILENATGRKPIYIGKPQPTMINMVREKYGYTKKETCVIGDRLYTDIASGNNAKVTTIAVLTGETNLKEIKLSKDKPTFVFKDINHILDIFNKLYQ